MNYLNKLLSNQREEGFSGKKKQTSKYLFVRVIFLVSKDRSKSTKGGGPSPLNICNMPYFLKKI